MSTAWPSVALGEVINHRKEFIIIDDLETYRRPRVQLHAQGIVLRDAVPGSEIKTKKQQVARAGEFLVAEIDAKVGGFGIVPDALDRAIVSSHYFLYGPNPDRLDKKYLGWFVKTRTFRQQVEAQGSTNYAAIRPNDVLGYVIPLPPLDEQRRIVACIEELAAKVEEAGRVRSSTLDELAALSVKSRDAILGLVAPSGTLGDVLQGAPRNGWSPVCANDDNGIPVLTLSAVTGWRFNANAYKRTSLPTRADAHYWAAEGDLLMTRSNTPELVGHAAIHSGSPTLCIYPDLMMKLRLDKSRTDTRFVWYWLQSTVVRDYIKRSAKGTSPTMKKISQSIVAAIPFPVHISIGQQTKIVAELDALEFKLNSVKALQADTAAELDAMLPAILDKAFKGGL